ncbi:transposase [Saccharothrix luteola]|uniref:transposase n=1 Tax=Saccharothrix luteola TaxID=2893018 RepID=UPI0022A83E9C|nr:transposase [Saccharothrix luteola]MCC8247666.1 transposase [Saccharothrix luteola]
MRWSKCPFPSLGRRRLFGAQTRELLVDRTLSKRRSARSSVVIVPDARGRIHRGCPVLPLGRLTSAHPTGGSVSHRRHRRPVGRARPAAARSGVSRRSGGRWEKHCRRVIVDAILYVVDNGIKWRALPSDFPPWPTVYKRFAAWE